ncbi:MAG: selenoneine synthase SenA [Ramlibacter sp.]
MEGTWGGYSVPAAPEALALRQGAPGQVRAALLAARERTLRLAEDYRAALGPSPQVPYAAELNPPLWELGHIAWFQEWWVGRNPQRALGVRADPGAARGAPALAQADAWYDSSRVPHRLRWDLPLPDAQATDRYLRQALEQTLDLLEALPADAGDDALYFFRLVAHHEQMHAEAAAYMAQGLGIPVRERVEVATGSAGELEVAGGTLALGQPQPGFAFDNELGAHEVRLAPFTIDARPVTWADFLPFMQDGGYEDLRWWTGEARAWLARLRRRAPAGLRETGEGWERLRGGTWEALPPGEAAVHLNAYEAEAWCHWAGRRLPTEAEWQWAATTHPGLRWGQVWEWTASAFAPYPGFEAHPYRDYSQPWFGTRRTLRGASPATAPALAHASYRNFFEPYRRDIFAGFRSVRALPR